MVDDNATKSLLLWDVDHTLIDSGGVSKMNYALAFELLVGRTSRVAPRTEGRTDTLIMEDVLRDNGARPEEYPLEDQWAALANAGELNRAALGDRGRALPGALDCLRLVSKSSTIIQSTLTGNIKRNAAVKLSTFGLDHWLDMHVGAFGEDRRNRTELVAVAQARAAERYNFRPDRDATVVIGDTRRDVRAGLDGGARVIGVATGASTADDLHIAGADAVLDDLQDVAAFQSAIERARQLGALIAPA